MSLCYMTRDSEVLLNLCSYIMDWTDSKGHSTRWLFVIDAMWHMIKQSVLNLDKNLDDVKNQDQEQNSSKRFSCLHDKKRISLKILFLMKRHLEIFNFH